MSRTYTIVRRYWQEPVPDADADGLYVGRLHPPEQSRIIQAMSWWGFGTGILGITHGKAPMGVCVMIGSGIASMYWAKPTYGFRRRLDMAWVQFLMWWHLIAGFYSPARATYYTITGLGVASYIISWGLMLRGYTWAAIYMHMLLTACANLSVTVLYTNPLPPSLFW